MSARVSIPEQQVGEPHFLLDWGEDQRRGRWFRAGFGSITVHILGAIAILLIPWDKLSERAPLDTARLQRVMPLIAPPLELTQPDPNKGKISKEINLESLLARPQIQIPPSAPPSTNRPAASVPGPPVAVPEVPKPAPQPVIEPPKFEPPKELAQAQGPVPGIGTGQQPLPPPPQIQGEEKPKLQFEKPGSSYGSAGGTGQSIVKVPVPNSSVQESIRNAVRSGTGGLVIGDLGNEGPGGIGPGIHSPPSPGRTGSNLELLSDPMGVDFRPYLVKVLSAVRRNWLAVIPESVRLLGRRGKVQIQFAINRDGGVPKLVIALPSGTEALDRAAVAGVSASNPFPPLPPEFRGDQVRLQFTFMYNLPSR